MAGIEPLWLVYFKVKFWSMALKKRIIRLSLTGWYITTNILGKLVATFLTVSWAAFFGMAQDKRVNPKSGQVVITEEEIHDQLLSTLASLSVDGISLFLG